MKIKMGATLFLFSCGAISEGCVCEAYACVSTKMKIKMGATPVFILVTKLTAI
jgi:hypothetical protein